MGSADNTTAIVRELADLGPRFELIQMSRNSGSYVAGSAALGIATGDYVTMHDADDWSHPQKFEKQVQRLQRPDRHVAVVSRWLRVGEDLHAPEYRRPDESLIAVNQSSLIFRGA